MFGERMKSIKILFTKISKYLGGKKKYLTGIKITKKGLLITAIISLVIIFGGIIITYLIVNIIYISELNTLKKILSNNKKIGESYEWWEILFAQLSPSDQPLNIRDVFIGFAGLATLIFTALRLMIIDQQKEDQVKRTNIESGRRLSERFDNAVAALSKELDESSFPSHLGAISSLRALAIDSSKNTQRCLDIICSCNRWMDGRGCIEGFIKEGSLTPYSYRLLNEDDRIGNISKGGGITLLQEKRSQEALRAISHILTRVSTKNPEQLQTLDFHNKMLCGISLKDIKLDRINFENTYLVAAKLNNVSLKGATLDVAKLEGASLRYTELQGASLRHTELRGTCLYDIKLQGADLYNAELQGSLLINSQLQGAIMDKIDLSWAILLDCNLCGVTLKNIKSKNVMFNDILDIDYIKNKKERREWLDDIRQYIEPDYTELFTQRMESAWQAMENKEEPDGWDIIRESPIITKYGQGIYDISKKSLNDLKEEWQKRVDKQGVGFLWSMNLYILSLEWSSNKHGNKNTNLGKKFKALIDELIESNTSQKKK